MLATPIESTLSAVQNLHDEGLFEVHVTNRGYRSYMNAAPIRQTVFNSQLYPGRLGRRLAPPLVL
jgi:hypothetical protein